MKKDFFKKGIAEIINENSLKSKLQSGKKLRIKMGVDPTSPDIHLGHAVGIRKLRQLQDKDHKIIFLIGDYTSKIGDPSGKKVTRPILSDNEIQQNAKTYFQQVGNILDVSKTEIRYNSEWYKKMGFNDLLQIAAKFTVAQILERDDFENRIKKGIDIGIHEMLYPIMQAYDSVILKADVEFGGNDQKFNMLAGRTLQRKMKQTPQDIVITKLLVGLDGKDKMSKSLDNYIGIVEKPETQFGKVMSISDKQILEYFELCTDEDIDAIKKYSDRLKKGENPRNVKAELAGKIVELYHGKKEAEKADKEFSKVFAKKELPSKIPEVKLSGSFKLPLLLIELRACDSSSEARRLITQNAVKIDGAKISDPGAKISLHKGMIIQVGKRKYYKISS